LKQRFKDHCLGHLFFPFTATAWLHSQNAVVHVYVVCIFASAPLTISSIVLWFAILAVYLEEIFSYYFIIKKLKIIETSATCFIWNIKVNSKNIYFYICLLISLSAVTLKTWGWKTWVFWYMGNLEIESCIQR